MKASLLVYLLVDCWLLSRIDFHRTSTTKCSRIVQYKMSERFHQATTLVWTLEDKLLALCTTRSLNLRNLHEVVEEFSSTKEIWHYIVVLYSWFIAVLKARESSWFRSEELSLYIDWKCCLSWSLMIIFSSIWAFCVFVTTRIYLGLLNGVDKQGA